MVELELIEANGLLLARILVGGYLLVSAASKWLDQEAFFSGIFRYRIIPRRWLSPLSRFVPQIEAQVGAWLVVGFQGTLAAAVTGLVFVIFTFAIVSSWSTIKNSSCYCLGMFSASHSLAFPLIRNVVALTLCGAMVTLGPGQYSLDGFLKGPSHDLGGAIREMTLCAFSGISILVLVILFEQFFVEFEEKDLNNTIS